MDEGDLSRRMARLRARPTMKSKSDELAEELLTEALEAFLDYTHRTQDPGERIDGLIVELAVVKANQIGAEGSTRTGEGDVSRMYGEDVPQALRRRMDFYRIPLGLR